MEKIRKYKFAKVENGHAQDIEELFEKVIKPQFENVETIKKIHRSLINYIQLKDITLFLRLYGSYSKDKYDLLRRGFVTKYSNGNKMAFCDNTFSLLFAGLKLADIPYTEFELRDYLNQPKVVVGFGQTTKEKELSFYTQKGALRANLNSKGWYQAHIKPTGYGYDCFNLRESFPNPHRDEWDIDSQSRYADESFYDGGLVLFAHFLRLIHPFNSFLIPKRNHVEYSGNNLGEETELILYVQKYLKEKFPDEYLEFDAFSMKFKFPEVSEKITDIKWFETPKAKLKKEKKIIKPTLQAEIRPVTYENGEETKALDLDRKLQSVGKDVFVTILYPEILSNPNVTYEKLADSYPRYGSFSVNSQKSRLSSAKSIFTAGLELEALKIVIDSKKVDEKVRREAKNHLNNI